MCHSLPVFLSYSLLAGGYWEFHRGKYVSFANRAQSWTFEARAPGYEKGERKNRGRGKGRGRRSLSLFVPPATLPRRLLLSTAARPAPPRHENGGHENSRRRKTPTPTVRLCEVFSEALFDLALSGTASAMIAFM